MFEAIQFVINKYVLWKNIQNTNRMCLNQDLHSQKIPFKNIWLPRPRCIILTKTNWKYYIKLLWWIFYYAFLERTICVADFDKAQSKIFAKELEPFPSSLYWKNHENGYFYNFLDVYFFKYFDIKISGSFFISPKTRIVFLKQT